MRDRGGGGQGGAGWVGRVVGSLARHSAAEVAAAERAGGGGSLNVPGPFSGPTYSLGAFHITLRCLSRICSVAARSGYAIKKPRCLSCPSKRVKPHAPSSYTPSTVRALPAGSDKTIVAEASFLASITIRSSPLTPYICRLGASDFRSTEGGLCRSHALTRRAEFRRLEFPARRRLRRLDEQRAAWRHPAQLRTRQASRPWRQPGRSVPHGSPWLGCLAVCECALHRLSGLQGPGTSRTAWMRPASVDARSEERRFVVGDH